MEFNQRNFICYIIIKIIKPYYNCVVACINNSAYIFENTPSSFYTGTKSAGHTLIYVCIIYWLCIVIVHNYPTLKNTIFYLGRDVSVAETVMLAKSFTPLTHCWKKHSLVVATRIIMIVTYLNRDLLDTSSTIRLTQDVQTCKRQ